MSFWNPKQWSKVTREKDFASIADWFITYFIVSGVGIIVLSGIAAGLSVGFASGARVLVISAALAAACAVLGWLFGLLFGIPRTLSRGAVSGSSSPDSHLAGSSRVNTNLEDISDWLTKTLVGVGLSSIFGAPHFIWHVADVVNQQGLGWMPYGRALALTLILFFASGGFWLGYVGTRTILTKLLDTYDGEPSSSTQLVEVKVTTLLKYLYEENGFESAIRFGRELLSDPEAKNTYEGRIYFAIACAYGQKHAVVKKDNPTSPTLVDLRLEVLKAARAAIARDPSQKKQLRDLWQANEQELESDLASIPHDDPEFTELLAD